MSRPPRVALMLELDRPEKRHTSIFAGTQQFAVEHGWDTIIDEFACENLSRKSSQAAPYDGVIGRVNRQLAERAARLALPVVNVWFTSPVWKQLPGVFPDYEVSGRMRAEHLLSRGLRRFAALSREDRGSKVETAAFRTAVEAAGFPCVEIKLPLYPTRNFATWQRSEKQIDTWMNTWRPPVGVFVSIDAVGRLIAQMCRRRDWRVPQDVAIITGWNEETICLHPRPSLSSIEVGYERIGYEAGKMLHRLMNQQGQGTAPRAGAEPQHLLIPPESLVVRESTDFFAVEDELVSAAMAFIAANSHRRIGQNDVARAISTETRTLQNRFRKVLNKPIAATIRLVRMERAKRELTQGNRSMEAIARDAGFGDPARMNDAFRTELGVTPSQYRKQRKIDSHM